MVFGLSPRPLAALVVAALVPQATLSAQQYDVLTTLANDPRIVADFAVPFADLDGDGTTDFFLGDATARLHQNLQGVVELRSGVDGKVLRRHVGDRRVELGKSLIQLDDIDKDGVPDYAIGAVGYPFDTQTLQAGRGGVLVYSGKTGQQLYVVNATALSTAVVDFGAALALVDDHDNDGLRDFCVASEPSNTAELYLISSKSGSVLRRWSYPNTSLLGWRLVATADFDQDGKRDVCTMVRYDRGIAIVSTGTGAILKSMTKISNGAADGDLDASSDLDGDGTPDCVFATQSSSIQIGSSNGTTGAVYAVSSTSSSILWKLEIRDFSTRLGQSLCSIDDVDADNVRDFVIGADRLIGDSSGVAIVSGKTGAVLETRIDEVIHRSGFLVSSAGDLNHDGHEDYFHVSSQFPFQNTTTGAVRVQSTVPLSLVAKTHNVPLIQGGYQQLDLDAGVQHANALAFVLGTASGTNPGISFGSIHLPLNPDVYFSAIASSPHAFLFNNLLQLDAQGRGQAAFLLPPGHPASLAGVTLHHAFLTLPNLDFASNAVAVRLTLFP